MNRIAHRRETPDSMAPLYKGAPMSPSEKSNSHDKQQLIRDLNEGLAREYQAIIAYVVYLQTRKGPEFMNIAAELEKRAGEELQHAIIIRKQSDYFGGMPVAQPKPVVPTEDNRTMLQADLNNETETIEDGFAESRSSREVVSSFAFQTISFKAPTIAHFHELPRSFAA